MTSGAPWRDGGAQEEERPSRSQKKRESLALQEIGERLAALPLSRLAELPLPPALRDALEDCARMGSRGARRRQLQYIGRLMREAQEEGALLPLLDALDRLQPSRGLPCKNLGGRRIFS
ncbi:MAG: DUF615 domain-containing protein [Mailhella sp.]|nr:DUF615 domain-containing protein [Mailhella sp.]